MSGDYVPKVTQITSTMIDAGVEVYLRHCPDTGFGDRVDRQMVREIFDAMSSNWQTFDIEQRSEHGAESLEGEELCHD